MKTAGAGPQKKIVENQFQKPGTAVNREKIAAVLPWLCLAVAYLAAVLFHLFYGEQLLNADMSAEIVLAKQLLEDGDFVVSSNWYYSTEIWVLNRHLTLCLGLLLFPHNWHLARTFSQAIMLAMHAGSYLFLTHECGLKRIGVYSAAILMCPFGFWYMWYGTYNGSYLSFMIFVSVGLALALHIARKGKHSGICLVLMVLLAFLQGLSGVRMLMNLYIPLLAACVLALAVRLQKAPLEKPWKSVPEIRLGLVTFLSSAVCGVGYLVNTNILSRYFTFEIYSQNQFWRDFDLQLLINILGKFLSLFGYPTGPYWSAIPWEENYLFSKSGLFGAFGFVFMAIVVFSAVRLLMRMKELTFPQLIVLLTFWMCFAVGCIVYSFLEDVSAIYASYWLPMIPLTIAVIAIEIRTEAFRTCVLRGAVTACLLFTVLCTSFSTVVRFLELPPRTRPGLSEVGEWLTENGYTQGYASFWNGNSLTELTDGEVEVWVVSDISSLTIYQWLQAMDHDEAPEGKVFVLLNPQDGEVNPELPYYEEEYIIYTDENGYVVLGFDSAEEVYGLIEEETTAE